MELYAYGISLSKLRKIKKIKHFSFKICILTIENRFSKHMIYVCVNLCGNKCRDQIDKNRNTEKFIIPNFMSINIFIHITMTPNNKEYVLFSIKKIFITILKNLKYFLFYIYCF